MTATPPHTEGLRVLVVDDEPPARDDLAWLLRQEPAVRLVDVAGDATEALRRLHEADVDVVFLDIRMPGLHGLDLARVLERFADPPRVVFVTAYEEHAVEAFELRACDYLLKPVRAERLRVALERVSPAAEDVAGRRPVNRPRSADAGAAAVEELPVLTVENAGRTRFVARADVRYAEASGDYTRIHSADGAHLVRIPLATLEDRWRSAGFFRIHRSYLVSLREVSELRVSANRVCVVVAGHELPVSRRQAHGLKEALVRARLGGSQ